MSTPKSTDRTVRIAEIEALLRDVPGTEEVGGPSYALPVELRTAIATHLVHCGVGVTGTADRTWVPPETEEVDHFMQPGRWKQVVAP